MNDQKEIIKKLENIFRKVLNNNQINLKFDTTIDELSQWDSLNHILIVLEIEKSFLIKITAGEIAELKSVSAIFELIREKVSKRV
tara:strand:- start:110 stop:364 length:255 start_codon:yes stop_codon:yes gene_type:complete